MNFSGVLVDLQNGKRLTRKSWAEGVYIILVPGSTFKVDREPLLGPFAKDTPIRYRTHIDILDETGNLGPWTVSQADVLATDWEIVQ